MIRMTDVKRAAVGGAVAALLLSGGAVPALATSPSVTVADCMAAKTVAKDAAKANFTLAKAKAWEDYGKATVDTKGSKKAAAQARRMALKTALQARKTAFVAARTQYRSCLATATDAPPTAADTATTPAED